MREVGITDTQVAWVEMQADLVREIVEHRQDVRANTKAVDATRKMVVAELSATRTAIGRLSRRVGNMATKQDVRRGRIASGILVGLIIAAVAYGWMDRVSLRRETEDRARQGCHVLNQQTEGLRSQAQGLIEASAKVRAAAGEPPPTQEDIETYLRPQGFKYRDGQVLADKLNCGEWVKNPENLQ